MNHTCPRCRRELYDRHLTNCGYCDAPIPEDRRYKPHEIAELEQSLADLQVQKQQQEEREARQSAAHIVIFPEFSSVQNSFCSSSPSADLTNS